MAGNTMQSVKKYFTIWKSSSLLSLQSIYSTRIASIFFTIAKFSRFFFFIGFLILIHTKVNQLAGYSLDQMIIFFLIFNLIDLFGQIFFRGIYWFRNQVISGEFDFALLRPVSALFQVLTQHTDILDVPLFFTTLIFFLIKAQAFAASSWLAFIISALAGMIVITSIHILVAALGVLTTEVDHTIMIFRDLSSMARVPIDIYVDSIRALLTFVIPVAIAFTFPAKALLGLLNPLNILLAFIGSLVFLAVSFKFWRFALSRYSSASS